MMPAAEIASQSFVLLRLGERRFAVLATQISELVAPSRIFRFPHRTAKLEGVILRRGRIIPVCDVAEQLLGKGLTSRRFYLIAVRHYGEKSEWVALPVTGDCELIAAEMAEFRGSRRSSRCRLDFAQRRSHRSLEFGCTHARRRRFARRQRACGCFGGQTVMPPGRGPKILLIDSNVYFAKRLGDALKREGFEVVSSTQAAYALTAIEYDVPSAILCSTSMREMGALEIAKIIHADPKNAALQIIALGDGSQRALMEAFQAGCDDYIDRQTAACGYRFARQEHHRQQIGGLSSDTNAGAVGHQPQRQL